MDDLAKVQRAKERYLQAHQKWLQHKCLYCLGPEQHKDKCENTVAIAAQTISSRAKDYFPKATTFEMTVIMQQIANELLNNYINSKTVDHQSSTKKNPAPSQHDEGLEG